MPSVGSGAEVMAPVRRSRVCSAVVPPTQDVVGVEQRDVGQLEAVGQELRSARARCVARGGGRSRRRTPTSGCPPDEDRPARRAASKGAPAPGRRTTPGCRRPSIASSSAGSGASRHSCTTAMPRTRGRCRARGRPTPAGDCRFQIVDPSSAREQRQRGPAGAWPRRPRGRRAGTAPPTREHGVVTQVAEEVTRVGVDRRAPRPAARRAP